MGRGVSCAPFSRFAGEVEEWPSGQWQQTVNLPTNVYVGSNPTSSTITGRQKRISEPVAKTT